MLCLITPLAITLFFKVSEPLKNALTALPAFAPTSFMYARDLYGTPAPQNPRVISGIVLISMPHSARNSSKSSRSSYVAPAKSAANFFVMYESTEVASSVAVCTAASLPRFLSDSFMP